jgi:hypothetical protein
MRLQKVTMIESNKKDYTNDEKNGQRYTTVGSGQIHVKGRNQMGKIWWEQQPESIPHPIKPESLDLRAN